MLYATNVLGAEKTTSSVYIYTYVQQRIQDSFRPFGQLEFSPFRPFTSRTLVFEMLVYKKTCSIAKILLC
jgi:hypothetical protein